MLPISKHRLAVLKLGEVDLLHLLFVLTQGALTFRLAVELADC